MVDIAEITRQYDVAQFRNQALAVIADIQRRNKVPVLCGGTGLYFRALLEGLGDAPAADPVLRKALCAKPLADLQAELASRDPDAYRQVDIQNPRRVIRALEVVLSTGRPFSEQRAPWLKPAKPEPTWFGLSRSAPDLRGRIRDRVQRMFEEGLVEETRQLIERGLLQNQNASLALGYRQVIEHIQSGTSRGSAIQAVTTRTHHYAKRQMTWFKNQMSLNWLELHPDEAADETAARIIAAMNEEPARL
jgi:tRNA dimethylallyltransferase